MITFETLSTLLADYLLSKPTNNDGNYEQTVSDVLQLLPKLESGLDINLHFKHCKEFEFTTSLSIFDVFNIDLVHGWVCSRNNPDLYHVVAQELKSYNAVVEAIIQGDVALTSSEYTSENDILIARGKYI